MMLLPVILATILPTIHPTTDDVFPVNFDSSVRNFVDANSKSYS